MPIGSVKGLLVTLLFVVPGGLGAALRRSLFAAHTPTAFTELLHSLAGSLVALLATETAFMVIDRDDLGLGDYLLTPLSQPEAFPSELRWSAYVAFFCASLALPTFGAWLRRLPPARWVFRAVSPHANGLDYIMHEARPRELRREEFGQQSTLMQRRPCLGRSRGAQQHRNPLR